MRGGERGKSREAVDGSWALGLTLFLLFQGGVGTVTTAAATGHFFPP